jgi:hypothetical protein
MERGEFGPPSGDHTRTGPRGRFRRARAEVERQEHGTSLATPAQCRTLSFTRSNEWRPSPGQLALIEPVAPEDGGECLTGVVMADPSRVVIDLGASPRPAMGSYEVEASFFAADALYRLSATAKAVSASDGVVELEVHGVERVQRRSEPRLQLSLPMALASFDDPGEFLSIRGETLDLAPGGCRVVTEKEFPASVDPTISITMPDGAPVVALARILDRTHDDGGWQYRLVFAAIDDEDRARLSALRDAQGDPPAG